MHRTLFVLQFCYKVRQLHRSVPPSRRYDVRQAMRQWTVRFEWSLPALHVPLFDLQQLQRLSQLLNRLLEQWQLLKRMQHWQLSDLFCCLEQFSLRKLRSSVPALLEFRQLLLEVQRRSLLQPERVLLCSLPRQLLW